MNNKERGLLKDQSTERASIAELNSQEALDITQRLVKEFIDTKQRMLNDDRKLNAIGKALITQKEMLDDILSAQDDRGNKLTDSLGDISNRQEDLAKGVFNITNSMMGIEEIQAEQGKLVQNLNHFQERHDDLVHKSTEQSSQSIERLESISEQVTSLFTQVGEVDIENRVVDIADRTTEISELLVTHAQKQADAREDASNKMLDLLAEVASFKQELSDEGLTGKLENVQTVSNENNQMIDELNEKFDIFVEIYEISDLNTGDELEDLFSDSPEDSFGDTVDDYTVETEDAIFVVDTEDNVDTEDELAFDADSAEIEIEFDADDTEDVLLEDTEEIDEDSPEELEDDSDEEVGSEYTEVQQDPEFSNYNVDESDEEYEDEEYEEYDEIDEDYENEVDEFGNDMEMSEYKRIEQEEDSVDSTNDTDTKGFFSKLFGGR